MDLMTLNASNQPAKLIENYDSLIWTERYNTIGDFQLTTGNVSSFMSLLPEGTCLTLRETNQVMIVETHKIERKKRQPEKLTITGRSFDSVLDRRVAIQSVSSLTGAADWNVTLRTPSDVAFWLMTAICRDGRISSADIFPAAQVAWSCPDYNLSTLPAKLYTIPRGNLLSVVLQLLQTQDLGTGITQHGLRAIRPSATATAVTLQVYAGVDRSGTIRFDATRELLDNGSYLFSKVGSANAAYGVASGIAATMYEGVAEPTGLARRVQLVDGTDSQVNNVTILQNYMSQTLADASETAIFDGSINPDLNPYAYGADYNLGDIVRVVGDYGLVQNARVTEYIRTEDASGQKAYPTLETIVA